MLTYKKIGSTKDETAYYTESRIAKSYTGDSEANSFCETTVIESRIKDTVLAEHSGIADEYHSECNIAAGIVSNYGVHLQRQKIPAGRDNTAIHLQRHNDEQGGGRIKKYAKTTVKFIGS